LVPQNEARKFILGVDLGGTKIVAAVATAEGEILTRGYCPTLGEAESKDVIGSMLRTIEETMSSGKVCFSQLIGIGIAAAGIIDSVSGMTITRPATFLTCVRCH
jgi:glucokinase